MLTSSTTAGNTCAVAAEVEKVLGDRLGKLHDIWLAAHATPDDDGACMLELGRRWCEVLGIDPKQSAPGRDPQHGRHSRLGIACDVSHSMSLLARPVASAAWILARAGAYIPDARSATVTFGESVHPVIRPGKAPALVSEFGTWDGTEEFCDAVDALDAALELSQPGAARMLVVVSDGRFRADQRRGGQERVARLKRAGCAVLWLALQPDAKPIEGALSITLADPADAVVAIGQAAIRALAAT